MPGMPFGNKQTKLPLVLSALTPTLYPGLRGTFASHRSAARKVRHDVTKEIGAHPQNENPFPSPITLGTGDNLPNHSRFRASSPSRIMHRDLYCSPACRESSVKRVHAGREGRLAAVANSSFATDTPVSWFPGSSGASYTG